MKNPIDGSVRLRVHLMRHAEAAYRGADKAAVPDARLAPLTARGRKQAEEMAAVLADVELDYALCSGLPRTRETAELVLGARVLHLAVEPSLEEIEAGHPVELSPAELAHPFERAASPGARFLEGEPFDAFRARVLGALEGQLAAATWRSALFVCHGAVNRVILGWALGGETAAWAALEQDPCCLNVLDFDVDAGTGALRRRLVRAVNVTPYDLAKRDIRLTSLEQAALSFARRRT